MTDPKHLKIGVLGGIGPEATAEFYAKLIAEMQARKMVQQNSDFPQIIINSIPTSELINHEASDGELKPYIRGLKELDSFGVDFIAIVCNTMYLFYELLQSNVRAPIINLREKLRVKLETDGVKSVFILGTPNTVKRGLYRFENMKSLEPTDEELRILSDAAFDFNRGVDKKEQIATARKICQKYLNSGSNTVILGCTELALMLCNEAFDKINTIDVLVDATIDMISSSQGRL